MKQLTVIHQIDWLQLHCNRSLTSDGSWHGFFKVKRLGMGTRHFKLVEELYRNGRRIATVTSLPHSPLLDPKMMLIKFDNWVLYHFNMVEYVNEFLALNSLTFKSISRLDICADFQWFANQMHPERFISMFVREKILKIGKTGKFKPTGKQMGNNHIWESLKFGSNLSEISYYLYNKTNEMKEVKWKPWIHKLWMLSGFDMSLDTWRLEFSIKSAAKCSTIEGGDAVSFLGSLNILEHEWMSLQYNILRNHYFRFVHKDAQQKKTRMKELRLFTGDYSKYKVIDAEPLHDSTRSTKIFIRKLEDLNQELRGVDFQLAIAAADLKERVIQSRGLQSWAMLNRLNG